MAVDGSAAPWLLQEEIKKNPLAKDGCHYLSIKQRISAEIQLLLLLLWTIFVLALAQVVGGLGEIESGPFFTFSIAPRELALKSPSYSQTQLVFLLAQKNERNGKCIMAYEPFPFIRLVGRSFQVNLEANGVPKRSKYISYKLIMGSSWK